MTRSLEELSRAASPGRLYATEKHDLPETGNSNTLSDSENGVYTVSTRPDAAGWETDSGFPGYGITIENAEFIAALWNAYRDGRLVEVGSGPR